MHVVQHAAWDADDEDFEVSPGAVFGAAGDVDSDAFVEFDLGVVEGHAAGAAEDVVELVGAVEQCYCKEPLHSDRERVEFLFKLYEELIAPLTADVKPKLARKPNPGEPGA